MMAYLHSLKQSRPWIFLVVVIFISIQFLVTLSRMETTPFFIFGMFSDRFHPAPYYEAISFKINEQEFNYMQFSDIHKEFVLSPTWQYYNLVKNNHGNPAAIKIQNNLPSFLNKNKFPANVFFKYSNNEKDMIKFSGWLKKYLSSMTEERIDHLEVFINKYKYKNDELILVSRNRILNER